MKLVFLFFWLIPITMFGAVEQPPKEKKTIPFKASITTIPGNIQKKMEQYTWHQGCPLPLKDLRQIQMTYWGFDNQSHLGSIIVNKLLAKEVTQIFKSLYEHRFPIERMELMDAYQGRDSASMSANNTSAYNCRDLTGHPGLFSQHSYGRAIDINPKINPYVKGTLIEPHTGRPYANRGAPSPGKIIKNSLIYKLFAQHGWDWAGNWYDVQDYQHFEKRADGEKRSPYGPYPLKK